MVRWIAALCVAVVAACASRNDDAAVPRPPVPSVRLTLPTDRRDNATLDSLGSFTRRVDADTTRMVSLRLTLELGAGSRGALTAWRSDSEWQRIHVDAEGAGYRTSDTYWLHADSLVAAHLEMRRPDQPAAVERVWFRSAALYGWVDAEGRRLNPEAQSTRTEVEMLRDRVARIRSALPPIPDPGQPVMNPAPSQH